MVATVAAGILMTGSVRAQAPRPSAPPIVSASLFSKRLTLDYGLFSPESRSVQRQVGTTWNKLGVSYLLVDPKRVPIQTVAALVYVDMAGQGDDFSGPRGEPLRQSYSFFSYGVGGRLKLGRQPVRNQVFVTGGIGLAHLSSSIKATRGGVPQGLEGSVGAVRFASKLSVGVDAGSDFYTVLSLYNLGKVRGRSLNGASLGIGRRF
jgi:hypothetical protein